MSCCGFGYEDSLEYIAPSNGNWGLVRVLCLVPETHILFIAPPACGRHSALGALQKNLKHRVSYYFLDRAEIIAGYDEEIKAAVRELLARLPKRPRAVICIVSCLDDLIGTDVERIMEELNEEIGDVAFRCGHMNPITMDTQSPPLVSNQEVMFSLLAPVPHRRENSVNLIAAFEPIHEACELYRVLEAGGISRVNHLSACRNYDEFQEMSRARLNLLLSPSGGHAGESMKQRLGIPFLFFVPSYRLETVQKQYEMLLQTLGIESASAELILASARKEAEIAIARAVEQVGDRPIRIAGGSVMRPFETARALIEYGFHVDCVIAQQVLPFEKEDAQWLCRHAPKLKYRQTQHFRTVLFEDWNPEIVGVGFHSAYVSGSAHVQPLMNDEFNFGYHGIVRLLNGLAQAAQERSDLRRLIEEYGLVI